MISLINISHIITYIRICQYLKKKTIFNACNKMQVDDDTIKNTFYNENIPELYRCSVSIQWLSSLNTNDVFEAHWKKNIFKKTDCLSSSLNSTFISKILDLFFFNFKSLSLSDLFIATLDFYLIQRNQFKGIKEKKNKKKYAHSFSFGKYSRRSIDIYIRNKNWRRWKYCRAWSQTKLKIKFWNFF